MKQFYFLLFFVVLFSSSLIAQFYPPDIYATNDYVLVYSNEMHGEIIINDTVTIGSDPYTQPYYWHFIAMFDTSGNYIWHKEIEAYSSNYIEREMAFSTDSNHSIYIASSTGHPYSYSLVDSMAIDSGMYVLKLDEQGNILNLIQPNQWSNIQFNNISLTNDTHNNLYLAGNFKPFGLPNTFSFGSLPPLSNDNQQHRSFIAKFDEVGNPLSLDTISLSFLIRDISFVNNQLYVTGQDFSIYNILEHKNQYITKLDTNGNLLKYIDIQDNNPQEDQFFNEFEVVDDGYWISGSFTNAEFGDGVVHHRNHSSLYLAKYDFNDSLIHLQLTPDVTTTYPSVQSLSVNDNDEIFWQFALRCGGCTWTVDGETVYSHSMMKLNSQNIVDCVTEMNRNKISANSTHYFSLNTYHPASYPYNAYFDIGKWNNDCDKEWETNYVWDVFIGTTNDIKSNTFQIFPNPTTNQLFLKTERTDIYELQYQILNISGQVIQNGIVHPSENQGITLNDFAGGVYFLRLQSDNAVETLKFVKY